MYISVPTAASHQDKLLLLHCHIPCRHTVMDSFERDNNLLNYSHSRTNYNTHNQSCLILDCYTEEDMVVLDSNRVGHMDDNGFLRLDRTRVRNLFAEDRVNILVCRGPCRTEVLFHHLHHLHHLFQSCVELLRVILL